MKTPLKILLVLLAVKTKNHTVSTISKALKTKLTCKATFLFNPKFEMCSSKLLEGRFQLRHFVGKFGYDS